MKFQLILIAILAKIAGVIFVSDFEKSWNNLSKGRWSDQFELITTVNPDELLIAEVSSNYLQGKGFVSSKEIIRPGHPYNETGLRPTYPVFIHLGMMRAYLELFPGRSIQIDSHDSYFVTYSIILHLVSTILFALSVISFSTISAKFIASDILRKFSIGAYLFYPSVFHFVGNLPCYESITMSILIIIFDRALILNRLSQKELFYTALCGVVASLLRPQLLIIYIVFLFFWGFQLAMNKIPARNFFLLVLYSTLICLVTSIPPLVKNHEVLRKVTLSTEVGFGFFDGHNPFARGSWCGDCEINPNRPVYQFVRCQIPGFDSLNEVRRSEALSRLALSWIALHPLLEAELILRKAAIFFLPYNSDDNTFNVYNFVVHVLTVFAIFHFLKKLLSWKKHGVPDTALLMAPLIGALVLSEIFFVGYRWRYFAEPFMILMSVQFVDAVLFFRKSDEHV